MVTQMVVVTDFALKSLPNSHSWRWQIFISRSVGTAATMLLSLLYHNILQLMY